ncbi:MAG TPA: hypothetical protein VK348_06205 [Planctomycetota bacterium]|nr:hypothetical protein [Planctomycetota bacterium]
MRTTVILATVMLATVVLVLSMLAACSSAPVPKERVEQEERRLLAPFLGGAEVGCQELLVELTGNFVPDVSRPAEDKKLHRASKEQGVGYTDSIWTNTLGGPDSAFVVTVGEPDQFTEHGIVHGRMTRFTVLNQVRLRVFEGKHAMALSVRASGTPLIWKAAAEVRDLTEFRVEDGVLHKQ